MVEEWKTIKDFPNYQVSNKGRVRNQITGHYLSLCNNPQTGYQTVSLYTGNGLKGRTRKYVHRLVLKAFDPPEDDSLITNHKDFDRENNCIENLEWVTQKQNVRHAMKHGKMNNFFTKKARRRSREATSKPIRRDDGKVYPSISAAARDLGVVKQSVWRACHEPDAQTKGYSFSFIVE